MKLVIFLHLFLLAFICNSNANGSQGKQKYNFLFIFVDDQGWSGTSVPMLPGENATRTPGFQMPNLEKMAKFGMVFSQAYAGHPKCECSRASLLMGMSTTSLNATDKNANNWNAGVGDSIANTLKKVDPAYKAAHFGKWQWRKTPESMGFDASDGITMNEDGDSNDPDDPKQSFGITRRAINYMNQQVKSGNPFYLQLSYYAVHSQPQALAATLKKYQSDQSRNQPVGKGARGGGAVMAAMTEDLDTCIGKLMNELDKIGIAENTYVIYMADNGMNSSRLKGGKTVLDEGGIRVPLIVKGPGVVIGQYCNVPVIGYDLFPTVIDIVNSAAKLPVGVEGGSWRPLFADVNGTVSRPVNRLVWHHDVEIQHPQTAIRIGNYKLLHYWDTKENFLYDMSKDIGETTNLADSEKDRAGSMLADLRAHVRQGLGESKYNQLESGKITGSARGGADRDQQKKSGRDPAKKKARAKNDKE
ncbi:MAG: Choline-sulfatase [Planctomycetota bacterium]|jgi:arylsulfatase A-like enzyme